MVKYFGTHILISPPGFPGLLRWVAGSSWRRGVGVRDRRLKATLGWVAVIRMDLGIEWRTLALIFRAAIGARWLKRLPRWAREEWLLLSTFDIASLGLAAWGIGRLRVWILAVRRLLGFLLT